jgi:hypothetical protein
MDFFKRVSILRTFETDCYSICLHLLQCEKLAVEAAEKIMHELFFNETFYLQDPDARKKMLKNITIQQALESYKARLNRDLVKQVQNGVNHETEKIVH